MGVSITLGTENMIFRKQKDNFSLKFFTLRKMKIFDFQFSQEDFYGIYCLLPLHKLCHRIFIKYVLYNR